MKSATRASTVADDGYRTLLDSSPQALLVHRDFVPCYANRALAELFGYRDEAEILALRTNLELVDPAEHHRARALATARLSGQHIPHRHEFRCLRKDGNRFWAEVIASAVPWEGEQGVQVCALRAEQELCVALRHLAAVEGRIADPRKYLS